MDCLIVEDDNDLALTFEACLVDQGHSAAVAQTVEEALIGLRDFKYDLLLLDYGLRDDTTEAVVDYAVTRCPHMKTMLITGSGVFPNGEAQRYFPGLDWILRKPVPLADLLAFVDHAEMSLSRDTGQRRVHAL
ncbi:response regulator [Poseidonocella sedimentorum]|uniref:Response regulator receiver domain-containing protein n=1 Tax=Poseidonocella sedimentorum TaxID=871652 RepID=A0A1I6CP44_9RHOB|nr:response regulator [Poseidonocella sedimentorum]SFQ94951.1 Response regulator receiver domain-containing protein [Poseidonocella sedimentorum]